MKKIYFIIMCFFIISFVLFIDYNDTNDKKYVLFDPPKLIELSQEINPKKKK